MTSEPRTPSTPQSLAQLRDSILERHTRGTRPYREGGDLYFCNECYDEAWPCPEYLLATLLSVENVAAELGSEAAAQWLRIIVGAGGGTMGREVRLASDVTTGFAQSLLGAIPVGGEKENR